MTENNPGIHGLHTLLDYDARKFIIAEIQFKKILPDWINMAGSLKLKTVLQKYLDFVQQHIQQMESFIEEEDITSLSLNNRVMQAFIEEAGEKLNICRDVAVKDACLLASIQVISHYKISTYGTAAAFAKALGMDHPSAVFHEAEINEKQIDDRLTQLAEHEININARAPFSLPQ